MEVVMSRGKVLVVGAGIAGLSTAWALVRRGFSVELFEQGPIPNPKATSYDEHRITRHAYGTFSGYARLMPDAFRAYDAMWADIGATHLDSRPLLVLARGAAPWYDGACASMDELGIGYREIPLAEVERRYPMVAPEGLTAVMEADGSGVLFPIRILIDLTVWLGDHGVVFRPMSLVTEVDPEAGAVVANGVRHTGDHVVVCAGAWVTRILPELAGTLVPSRQAVVFISPPLELVAAWKTAPVIIDLGEHSGTYTLPARPGTRLKVGDHNFSRVGDPDGDRTATEDEVERLMAAARVAYKDFDRYMVLERKACFYTVTDDERFVVRPIGAKAIVVSACSGHGFKLGALMGQGVAEAIAGERALAGLADWAAGLPVGAAA